MKNLNISLILAVLFWATACAPKAEQAADTDGEAKTEMLASSGVMEAGGLTLTPLTDSPAFAEASLTLETADVSKDGKTAFNFTVENYELGAQTETAATNGLANSGKGQHIHFIDNNSPYSAHYEASFEKELAPGNHVVLAFLSRSFHESVKNGKSFAVEQFQIGDEEVETADLSKPHMFYSRPKGTYRGTDTEKLMLDFFLVNCDLSEGGYYVVATINGTPFTIKKWQPYVIEGLEKGELSVKLELFDAEGNLVDSPFNGVERTVALEEAAAE